jgi:hypothetical protein
MRNFIHITQLIEIILDKLKNIYSILNKLNTLVIICIILYIFVFVTKIYIFSEIVMKRKHSRNSIELIAENLYRFWCINLEYCHFKTLQIGSITYITTIRCDDGLYIVRSSSNCTDCKSMARDFVKKSRLDVEVFSITRLPSNDLYMENKYSYDYKLYKKDRSKNRVTEHNKITNI